MMMQSLLKPASFRCMPSPSLFRPLHTSPSSFPSLPPPLPNPLRSSLASLLSPLHLPSLSIHSPLRHPSSLFAVSSSSNGSLNPDESVKREQVSKLLDSAARNFRRYGTLGFWGQLVCTVVSAVILAFSVAISGTPTSQATFYATAGGITAAFVSVFWSYGYIRLSERLRSTVNDLKKAPPRAEVVKNLRNGVVINLLGMGLTLLGLQATVGTLVAKSLTSTAGPYLQGTPAGYSPVLALDVFLVQASSNTVLSHFLGLVFSLELLRSITLSQPPPEGVIPKLT